MRMRKVLFVLMMAVCSAQLIKAQEIMKRCEIHLNSEGDVRGIVFGPDKKVTGYFSLIKSGVEFGYAEWNGQRYSISLPIEIHVQGEITLESIRQILISSGIKDCKIQPILKLFEDFTKRRDVIISPIGNTDRHRTATKATDVPSGMVPQSLLRCRE